MSVPATYPQTIPKAKPGHPSARVAQSRTANSRPQNAVQRKWTTMPTVAGTSSK